MAEYTTLLDKVGRVGCLSDVSCRSEPVNKAVKRRTRKAHVASSDNLSCSVFRCSRWMALLSDVFEDTEYEQTVTVHPVMGQASRSNSQISLDQLTMISLYLQNDFICL